MTLFYVFFLYFLLHVFWISNWILILGIRILGKNIRTLWGSFGSWSYFRFDSLTYFSYPILSSRIRFSLILIFVLSFVLFTFAFPFTFKKSICYSFTFCLLLLRCLCSCDVFSSPSPKFLCYVSLDFGLLCILSDFTSFLFFINKLFVLWI